MLGFMLASLLFLVAFMDLGGYRNHVVIWRVSVLGTVLIALRVPAHRLCLAAPRRAAVHRFTYSVLVLVGVMMREPRARMIDILWQLGARLLNCLTPIHLRC